MCACYQDLEGKQNEEKAQRKLEWHALFETQKQGKLKTQRKLDHWVKLSAKIEMHKYMYSLLQIVHSPPPYSHVNKQKQPHANLP